MTTEEKAIFRRRASWVAFSVLTLWIIGVRWHLRFEPLERDISTYAVIGRELLAGRPLYSDLWDHKPPPFMCFLQLRRLWSVLVHISGSENVVFRKYPRNPAVVVYFPLVRHAPEASWTCSL